MLVAQSCPTPCNPTDCSPSGSSVCRIFQARILECFVIAFSRGSSQHRDRTWISCVFCIAGRFFTCWAIGEAQIWLGLIFKIKKNVFLWRIVALQTFVVFCQTSTWVSHSLCISPPFWTSLPSPSPSHPSRLIQSPCLSFLSHTANSCWLSIYIW